MLSYHEKNADFSKLYVYHLSTVYASDLNKYIIVIGPGLDFYLVLFYFIVATLNNIMHDLLALKMCGQQLLGTSIRNLDQYLDTLAIYMLANND